jgi:hypothetical protein
MKKLVVLFALMAIATSFSFSQKRLPAGSQSVQLGYFTVCNGQNTYNLNINATASQEGTFTIQGNFGSYWPTSCFFYPSQTIGSWIVTFNMIEFTNNYGWWSFTSSQFDENYTSEGLLFNSGLNYSVTYTVTSASEA